MNLYHLHAGLAGVTFLGVLGLLIPRARGAQASALAGVVWLGLLVVAWDEWGWKAGVVAVAMSLLYAAVSLPLAGPVARSLFGL